MQDRKVQAIRASSPSEPCCSNQGMTIGCCHPLYQKHFATVSLISVTTCLFAECVEWVTYRPRFPGETPSSVSPPVMNLTGFGNSAVNNQYGHFLLQFLSLWKTPLTQKVSLNAKRPGFSLFHRISLSIDDIVWVNQWFGRVGNWKSK